ncbi:hypothetical protein GGR57DRAFT_285098 [Xylariaceae sp. FL1272]|nr:hypothetical protein GGR57DRAFT_285098 [Xylariaceae sp. FL1272]
MWFVSFHCVFWASWIGLLSCLGFMDRRYHKKEESCIGGGLHSVASSSTTYTKTEQGDSRQTQDADRNESLAKPDTHRATACFVP